MLLGTIALASVVVVGLAVYNAVVRHERSLDQCARGYRYLEAGDLDTAEACFDRAVELNPDFIDAYLYRGRVYAERALQNEDSSSGAEVSSLLDRAVADLDQAIRLNDRDGTLEMPPLAECFLERWQLAEAYYWRGKSHAARGDFKRGIADMSDAIRVDPRCVEARLGRAQLYVVQGQDAKAIADVRFAADQSPLSAEALWIRAEIHEAQLHLEEAVYDYTSMIEVLSHGSEQQTPQRLGEVYDRRGDAYVLLKRWDDAIRDYTRAMEYHPRYADARTKRDFAMRQRERAAEPGGTSTD